MTMGPTMDMAIVRETFTRTLQAAEMLGLDESLQAELKDKLPPPVTLSDRCTGPITGMDV